METAERTKILSAAESAELIKWKDRIYRSGDVQMLKKPNLGLVMMRAEESVEKQVFNVGEILVSEAAVSVDGELGFAAVIGNEEEKVTTMALIDAVYHNSSPKWTGFKEEFTAWLTKEQQRQKEEQLKEYRLMDKSRVDFEVMDE